MKTKNGQTLNVVGQVNMKDGSYFIVALPHATYTTVASPEIRKLINYVLVPFSEFDIANGNPDAELVK